MKTEWFLFCEDESDKKRMREEFAGSRWMLDHLDKVIDRRINESHRTMRDKTYYEMPCWDKYMADQLGYQRALIYIKSLIEESDK